MATGKRKSAFSAAFQQAQAEAKPDPKPQPANESVDSVWNEINMPEEIEDLLPSPPNTDLEATSTPASAKPERPVASQEEVEKPRNKGGRPKGPSKKKSTYYLRDNIDADLDAIAKGLVRHADTLLRDKGDVVDQAVALMRFGLEDEVSRELFLKIYQRWSKVQ